MGNIYVTQSSMPTYEEYCEAIKPLWDSHWLTNMGEYHNKLESELKEKLNVPEVSLMVNGHLSLELAIQAFGFPEGSEIITTPFTFISTTHAIIRNNLEPVFCDVKESDGTIDESKIEALITPKTVAILPVHVYGHICNYKEIQEIANKYNLKVIYDAAHAFGEQVDGIGVGNLGDISIFSFHATKVFNTIEGGAATFKDHWIYEKLYNLKNFGIQGEELVVQVGANAKMNEFSAIMGLCNLRHYNEAIEGRKNVAEIFDGILSNVKGIKIFAANKNQTVNYAYYPILVTGDYRISRDELYNELKSHGIYARKYFYPLTSNQACFKNKYKDIDIMIANYLSDQILVLPIYEKLGKENAERIAGIICHQ